MELLDNIRTVVAYLRGRPGTRAEFKKALHALVNAGMLWWVGLDDEARFATLAPCDPGNVASVSDYLDAQCRLCEGHGAAQGETVFDWRALLPILLEILNRWLNK